MKEIVSYLRFRVATYPRVREEMKKLTKDFEIGSVRRMIEEDIKDRLKLLPFGISLYAGAWGEPDPGDIALVTLPLSSSIAYKDIRDGDEKKLKIKDRRVRERIMEKIVEFVKRKLEEGGISPWYFDKCLEGIELEEKAGMDPAKYLKSVELKTGYLTAGSAVALTELVCRKKGEKLGEKVMGKILESAKYFGMAVQLVDDFFDFEKDLQNGRYTLLAHIAMRHGDSPENGRKYRREGMSVINSYIRKAVSMLEGEGTDKLHRTAKFMGKILYELAQVSRIIPIYQLATNY